MPARKSSMRDRIAAFGLMEEHLIPVDKGSSTPGRKVFRYEDGWSDHRIADQCNVPVNTICSMRLREFGELSSLHARNAAGPLVTRIEALEKRVDERSGDLLAVTDLISALEDRVAKMEKDMKSMIQITAKLQSSLHQKNGAKDAPQEIGGMEVADREEVDGKHAESVLKAIGSRMRSLSEIVIDSGLRSNVAQAVLDRLVTNGRVALGGNGRYYVPHIQN